MDKATLVGLVGIDIEDGERLLEALDEANLDIRAALWVYMPDSEEWRFMIASPLVDREGSREAYVRIQSVLMNLAPPSGISLRNISAVGLEHSLIQAMRTAAREYPGMVSKRWFKQTVINDVFIEAAYVYRVKCS